MVILFLLTLIFLKYINSSIIYQCSRYQGIDGQCMNKWIDQYGNTRIDLWICPKDYFCQILSNDEYDQSIGVCAHNYKKLLDQDECTVNSQCASLHCDEEICSGFWEGQACHPGSFQCKNNLVCRKGYILYPYREYKEIYRCANLSNISESCNNDYECEIKLVCSNKNISDYFEEKNIFELKNETNLEEYINIKKKSSKKCINRASLENGYPTDNPMACKSGDVINYEIFSNYTETLCASKLRIINDCNESNFCTIEVNLGNYGNITMEQSCIYTTRGNPLCPLKEKEKAWNKYLSSYDELLESTMFFEEKRKTIIHIPKQKNDLGNNELSEAFFGYNKWEYVVDSDICTKTFFFPVNYLYNLNFSIINIFLYFALIIL